MGILTSSSASNLHTPGAWQAHALCEQHRPSPGPRSSKTSGGGQPGDIRCDSAPRHRPQAHRGGRPHTDGDDEDDTAVCKGRWNSNTRPAGWSVLGLVTNCTNNRNVFSHSSGSQDAKMKTSAAPGQGPSGLFQHLPACGGSGVPRCVATSLPSRPESSPGYFPLSLRSFLLLRGQFGSHPKSWMTLSQELSDICQDPIPIRSHSEVPGGHELRGHYSFPYTWPFRSPHLLQPQRQREGPG